MECYAVIAGFLELELHDTLFSRDKGKRTYGCVAGAVLACAGHYFDVVACASHTEFVEFHLCLICYTCFEWESRRNQIVIICSAVCGAICAESFKYAPSGIVSIGVVGDPVSHAFAGEVVAIWQCRSVWIFWSLGICAFNAERRHEYWHVVVGYSIDN